MKRDLLPYIIITIIIIIVITIVLIILKDKLIVESKEIGHIDFGKIDKVTDRNDYYMVKTILNKYYSAINYLEADIRDLSVEYTDIESEQEEIIREYTNTGITILKDILDKECVNELSLNADNILENFKQYKNSEYTIEEMYYVEKNINTSLYYIKGMLDYKDEFELIVKTDSYTGTFSIYSNQYIKEKDYKENSIETEFNIDGIEYIEKNDNNEYIKNNITDTIMAQYYLYDYGDLVLNHTEKAYEKLEDEYKKIRFPTLEEYKKYIESSEKQYNLLKLQEYSMQKKEDYIVCICKDQYGDTYIFKDTNIMEYKLQLDSYTIENEELTEQYKNLSNKEKVTIAIEKLITMINMKDYKSAYNLLDSNFKQKYFTDLSKFESYIKTKTFNHNRVIYKAYSDEIAPIYIYNIILEDVTNESKQNYNFKILIKLLEETNFAISFNMD